MKKDVNLSGVTYLSFSDVSPTGEYLEVVLSVNCFSDATTAALAVLVTCQSPSTFFSPDASPELL
jgi:hypothetical protein